MLLRGLLFFQLVYVVNQIHFHLSTGIPGVAPANVLMLLIFFMTLGKPDQLPASSQPMLQKPLLYFFAALTFSFLWGQWRHPTDFLDDLTYYKNALFFPLFYFIYLRCRQDEKTTRQLIITIMFVAAVAGLEAIREGLAYGFGTYNPFHRASGPFGEDWHNANRAGVFYAMFTPMFVALALFLRGGKLWRLAAIAGAALVAGGALFTYSRQAYFIILLGVALLLLRKSLVVAVIIGALLVSAVGLLPDAVTERVDETATQGKHGEEEIDASTASRWEIWAGAMDMLADHPIGVGLHKFSHEIGQYSSHKGMDAHNFYVLTLAEAGPVGLGTLLFLFGTILFKLSRFLRKHAPPDDPETKALAIGFTVCTICMALGGIYGSPFFEGAVMAPYWALCGLLERYIQLKMEHAVEPAAAPVEATLVEKFPLAAHVLPQRQRR
ncbi:MAG TPA: O-antigen ligase family protein [Polyangia bacterium]|nr:O-antigen ligase family protein [Polyangia bacterium]